MRFQTEEHVLRVNKSQITDENSFNGNLLETEDKHEYRKGKKFDFMYFADLLPVLEPLDHGRHIFTFFKYRLIFANFKLFSVGFGS